MKDSLHFVGIGGIGMSAIAHVLLERGNRITGSDVNDSPIVDDLRRRGASIAIGHDTRNVNGASAVVVSSAIDAANPEYRHARERGIPIVPRGEMLRRIMSGRRGIAVCGTHGKTTTTAMVAHVLARAGIDASLVLGGIDVLTGTNAHEGSAAWFLTEADESDGSFALLEPEIAVVTNVENDHLASDAELPKLVASFDAFLARVPAAGTAIVGVDNPQSRSIADSARLASTLTFGIAGDAIVRAEQIAFADLGSSFHVFAENVCLGEVQLQVPGAINVENALAAIAVAHAIEVPFTAVRDALAAFRGVRRRFEIIARTPRMIVVDDYAHHPTAVEATIVAARQYHKGPVIVAFQPHRYTRTAYLASAFARSLAGADRVYVSSDLRCRRGADRRRERTQHRRAARERGKGRALRPVRARLARHSCERSAGKLAGADAGRGQYHQGRRGTCARRCGRAGMIEHSLLSERDRATLVETCGEDVRFDEPLAPYTSWKIGGPADAWIVVHTREQLAALMRFCARRKVPFFVLGSGSNLLVGDGGIRGLVLRLAGAFTEIAVTRDHDNVIVHAGASASMSLLTAKAASAGAAGIGALAGIPGSVGGSLRMNAGTDREMSDFVREVWVHSPSKPDAHRVNVHYYYRHTSLARDAVVSSVTLCFPPGDPKSVRADMQQRLVRRKRTQPIALPNAGSCFRNPPGDKAARLIEAGGAKGWRQGDAEVSALHANFINNLGNASAKDVATLLARVRRLVTDRFGIDLQLEVHLVGVFIDT